MFCWGSSSDGQLGVGGIEEGFIPYPRRVDFPEASNIVNASCGISHTVVVTANGAVFSCGLNDYGQLGHQKGCMRFEKIDALSQQIIKDSDCGLSHSLALNEWGQIFSWGRNNHGQLGISHPNGEKDNDSFTIKPQMVKSLATLQVIQIACGYEHSLALTKNGIVYAWGNNSYGQLGIGTSDKNKTQPCVVKHLSGVPILQIATGGYHSFAVTVSGAVYGWGKNSLGQLGFEKTNHHVSPTHLEFLDSRKIIGMCCGEEHSAASTLEGGIFTWGAGTYGQLGHGSFNSEYLPRQVTELMGTSVSQVTCGRRHTLAYVPSSGNMYAFGLGGSGQLGLNRTSNSAIPAVIRGPWTQCNGGGMKSSSPWVYFIASGGAQSLAVVTEIQPSLDMKIPSPETQIARLNKDSIGQLSCYLEEDSIPLDIMSHVETIFSSLACLNCSFLQNGNQHFPCSSTNHGIDFALVKEEFSKLASLKNTRLVNVIADCLAEMMRNQRPSPSICESLRIFLLLPNLHFFSVPEKYLSSIIGPFTEIFKCMISCRIFDSWLSVFGLSNFKNMINVYKKIIAFILTKSPENHSEIEYHILSIMQSLKILQRLHVINYNGNMVSYEEFYIPSITEKIDIQQKYVEWVYGMNREEISFFDFPFVFDASAKSILLETDANIQKKHAMDEAHFQNVHNFFMCVNPVNPFFVLHVDRNNLVFSTLQQLNTLKNTNLNKPLKVVFKGEEAVDQGGVRKEFFLLLMKELLDPNYGMFTRYSETYNIWFSETTFEDDSMFYLVGIVCGLAIYNATIIDLPFPLALYKKLLSRKINFEDLSGLSPLLVRNLKHMLQYEGLDFEDVFCLSFEITRENFGHNVTIELKPNGKNIAVNQSNKQEYVDLYVDYVLTKSVEKKYQAFHHGFHQVCGGRVLELFQPAELMEMVIGKEEYDWDELEANTEYKDRYSKEHITIKYFWKVFRSLTFAEKKKFLLFLSGSDRIPSLGMKTIKLIIQPMLVDEHHLPAAHTCFNLLDLPEYKSEAQLRAKLLLAINHTQGFGLV